MKHLAVLFILTLLVGCATHRDDPRLQGTWRANRDATVAEAFRRDPRWANAPPDKVERFRGSFGHMTITYSNGVLTADYRGEVDSFRYRVVERGPDYVIIRSNAPGDKGRDIRIHFVDGNSAYWIDTGPLGFGLQERFDRVTTPAETSRPMNVQVARGSSAESACRALAGLPGQIAQPEAIVPGIGPTPDHDLRFHGGKTIGNLTFKNFYIGGVASWRPNDVQSIDQALAAAMSDERLNNVMVQYFAGQPITTTALPSEILSDAPPAVVSQGDIENFVRDLYTQGKLAGNDLGSTVFNFMLPSGTVLNTDITPTSQPAATERAQARRRPAIPHDEEDSLHGLGGYHGSVHVPRPAGGGQDTVYYAIAVYSETLADGSLNGIPVFAQSWKNVVASFYHELNEARTDADVEDAIAAGNDPNASSFLGWVSDEGEECGDLPVAEANPLTLVFQEVPLANGNGTVPVQFQYSNAVHGPEGPIATPHPPAVR